MWDPFNAYNREGNGSSRFQYDQSDPRAKFSASVPPSIPRSHGSSYPMMPMGMGTPGTLFSPMDRCPQQFYSTRPRMISPHGMNNCNPPRMSPIGSQPFQQMTSFESGQVPLNNMLRMSPSSWPVQSAARGSPRFRGTVSTYSDECPLAYNIAKEPSVAAALDRISRVSRSNTAKPLASGSFQSQSPRFGAPQIKQEFKSMGYSYSTFGLKPVPDLSSQFDTIISGNTPPKHNISTNFVETPAFSPRESLRFPSHFSSSRPSLNSPPFYGERRGSRFHSSRHSGMHLDYSPRKWGYNSPAHGRYNSPVTEQPNRRGSGNNRDKYQDRRDNWESDDEYEESERRSRRRAYQCYSPPFPEVVRQMKYSSTEGYYTKSLADQEKHSSVVGTGKLKTLCEEFEEQIRSAKSVVQLKDEDICDPPTIGQLQNGETSKQQLADETESYQDEMSASSDEDDDDDSDAESNSSVVGMENENSVGSGSDDDVSIKPRVAVEENRKRKLADPLRLHPELWFNEHEQTNDGPVCRCSTKDRKKGIRHSIYPGEKNLPKCDTMGNNSSRLHHYWIAITPHTNFMMEHPTVITVSGKNYTFEGFSILSHKSLEQVPLCTVIRFNIEYSIHVVQEPLPQNFCIAEVDAFSKYLFHDILEMFDWRLQDDRREFCQQFHFLPRFVHRYKTDKSTGKEVYEMLSMADVLAHVMNNSGTPMIQPCHFELSDCEWEKYADTCMNSIMTTSGKKPGAVRVDDVKFDQGIKRSTHRKVYPYVTHNGIRPAPMSYVGSAKYQRLWKSYVRLRNKIANRPIPSRKDQDSLVKLKIELEKFKMKSSMRRDVLVRMSSKGLLKTGLSADVCQHALMLPVLVHHLRYHSCLESLDDKLGYKFDNRTLLQLALTHPSYHLNFGTNPDQARNSLANCAVRQPRYGDRRIHHIYTRKRGIMQLIRVMSNLGRLEEHQSMRRKSQNCNSSKRKLLDLRNSEWIRHNERLEFLGDAVLEFICSVHLFYMLPDKSEGNLAMFRSALVQNKNLSQLAKKIDLSDFMQFAHGPDLCQEEDMNHAMANCFEALLGAVFLEGGLECATNLFCKLAFDEEDLREVWLHLPKHPLQEQQPEGDRHFIDSSPLLQKLVQFEASSGIEFSHIRLLARAFTHPQVGFNNLTMGNNQRLEFLGDSVLQFVVSVFLYKHFPEHHEGHLTLLRSSLVNSQVQATVARDLGLDEYINFGKKEIPNIGQKLLADVLEAFVAALFVDKGLQHVEGFCKVCFFSRLEDCIINQDWMDAKSQLQQCCLSLRSEGQLPDLPVYKILSNKGPAHHKKFTVGVYFRGKRLGTGEGQSVQQAEMAAAKDGLSSAYFPELARQKKLLDRKHGDRRRNYCNRNPRGPDKDANDAPQVVGPCWVEGDSEESGSGSEDLESSDSAVTNKKARFEDGLAAV